MTDLMYDCYHCDGTSKIQHGSLEGNDCSQCTDGKSLTPDGQLLARLCAAYMKELN